MIRKLLLASIVIGGCTIPCLTEVKASTLQNSAKVNLVQQSDSSPSFLIANDKKRIDRKYKSGRGDPHGRSHDLPSLDRQLDEINEHIGRARGRDRTRLIQKKQKIQRAKDKARKGTTHGRRERGQQRFERFERFKLPNRLPDTL